MSLRPSGTATSKCGIILRLERKNEKRATVYHVRHRDYRRNKCAPPAVRGGGDGRRGDERRRRMGEREGGVGRGIHHAAHNERPGVHGEGRQGKILRCEPRGWRFRRDLRRYGDGADPRLLEGGRMEYERSREPADCNARDRRGGNDGRTEFDQRGPEDSKRTTARWWPAAGGNSKRTTARWQSRQVGTPARGGERQGRAAPPGVQAHRRPALRSARAVEMGAVGPWRKLLHARQCRLRLRCHDGRTDDEVLAIPHCLHLCHCQLVRLLQLQRYAEGMGRQWL